MTTSPCVAPSVARLSARVSSAHRVSSRVGRPLRATPPGSSRSPDAAPDADRAADDDDVPLSAARRAFAAAAAAATVTLASLVDAPPSEAITANNLLFLEAWRAVDKAYVDKTFNNINWFKYREDTVKKVSMDSTDETYDAIRAMLAKLDDPFTKFLEPEKYASLTESTMSANITGVGVEMAYGEPDARSGADAVVVVAPTPGGPADQAGVRSRDRIVAVDGRSTDGLTMYEVADALQGPANSKVELTLRREGDAEDVSATVTRRKYALVPVQSQTCGPAAGTGAKVEYVRLTTFNQLSGAKVREAVEAGKSGGAEAFVLDLRKNSGGLFPGALDIAKLFMSKGTIVLIADSDGVRDVFETDNTAIAPDAPLTLLVDSGTASASEVLAGALQDNGRARVLGEQTFGKGLIQTVVPLTDGSAVSVTVARYQTPNGTDINKIGIQPDASAPKVAPKEEGGEPAELPVTPEAFCAAIESDADVARKLFK